MNRRRSKLPCGWNHYRIFCALIVAIIALLIGAIRFWL